MVARIAPSPIASSIAIGDVMTLATESPAARAERYGQSPPSAEQRRTDQQAPVAEAPPPPTPPGEAFAAAVISGQLAPKPVTPEELRQRLGAAWQPPNSPLRLMDKIA